MIPHDTFLLVFLCSPMPTEINKLPKTAYSLFFYKKGGAKVAQTKTPYDILQKNEHKNGRWNVAIKPLIVGLCPSDMAGGMLQFPPSSRRTLSDPDNPAVAGHEFVGKVIAAGQEGLRQLKQRGIRLGDLVAGDINVGCGLCFQCKRGDPPVYCVNGATFAGVGSTPYSEDWVMKQTGRPHVPGAYTEGFIVLPAANVYRIPLQKPKETKAFAIFSQVDAVACAMTSCVTMGLTTFSQTRGFDNPLILIIGAGRLGMWHAAVIRDILPNAQIFLADIKKENLSSVASLFGIPKKRQYHVGKTSPFSRTRIQEAFGKNTFFDIIIDTAGHGVLTGKNITSLLLTSAARGGKFWTTAHTGITGVDAGHPMLLAASKSFGNGLSPQNNFPYAIDFLAREGKRYVRCMSQVEGGLRGNNLVQIVSTGGLYYKRKAAGIIFYSVVNPLTQHV